MEFSIVVPVFNEEESLFLLQEELNRVAEKFSGGYEIIYVNDASTDSSLKALEELREKYQNIKIVSFDKNKGQSAALLAGFKESRGKWIITLDADLQNPPREIVKLLPFKNSFDLVAGVRVKRKDSIVKIVGSAIAGFFRWVVLGDTTKDIGCSLKVFKREIIDCLAGFSNFDLFFTFLVRKSGFSVKEVGINHRRRRFGRSKYSMFRKTKKGISGLWRIFCYINFNKPLTGKGFAVKI